MPSANCLFWNSYFHLSRIRHKKWWLAGWLTAVCGVFRKMLQMCCCYVEPSLPGWSGTVARSAGPAGSSWDRWSQSLRTGGSLCWKPPACSAHQTKRYQNGHNNGHKDIQAIGWSHLFSCRHEMIQFKVQPLLLTLTLYQASISRRFFSLMPSYWALISSKTLFRSSWGLASTSTFTELPETCPRRAASSWNHDNSNR